MGACLDPGHIMFVTELFAYGNVAKLLHRNPMATAPSSSTLSLPPLDLQCRLSIALGVAQGLAWMHGCNPPLIHGDLTLGRLFVSLPPSPPLPPSSPTTSSSTSFI